MNLRTEEAFWLMKNGLTNVYKTLESNMKTDVVVIGAGITGALASYYLSKAGIEVIVLDKRHPGMGSTAASTALLQYEIDEPMHSLKKIVGNKRASQSYLACINALGKLKQLVRDEKLYVDFEMVPSLQYASYKKDVALLKEEFKARKKLGIEVELLEPVEIKKRFFLDSPGALWSAKGGKVDPYALTQGLLKACQPNLKVFDGIEVKQIETNKNYLKVKTSDGKNIKAKYAIVACGYEAKKFLPFSVVKIGTTYAFVTKPLDEARLWENETLLWETKTPYLYIRTTPHHRLLAGGRDDSYHNVGKRNKLLPIKINALVNDVQKLLNMEIKSDFAWAGAFGSTKDSLGYVGSIKQLPRVFFILGYGGNGILYSQIGAEIVRDSILARKNALENLFEFER